MNAGPRRLVAALAAAIVLAAGENFISFDNTPAVGFHVGFSQRF